MADQRATGSHGPLPGHAVVGSSEAEWGAEGVGLWRAGTPSGGHRHGLIVHHTAVFTALREESWHSERLRFGWALRDSLGGSLTQIHPKPHPP